MLMKMLPRHALAGITTGLALAMLATGCLKTRAQLKDDDDRDAGKPMPAQVQDVEPKGQYVIDEMKAEITRLTGRIEDLERNLKQDEKKATGANREEIKKLETRLIELEQAQAAMLEAIKKLEQSAATQADPSEHLEKGKAQFKSENYEGAIESLNAYLKSPKAKKVEDATFLRAEAYYKAKQYKKAIVDYSKFPEKFTKSDYMPVALYKIGLSFDALNMHEDAKGFYQELIEKFPKSPEAKKARKKVK